MDTSSGEDDAPMAVPLDETSLPSSGMGDSTGGGEHVPVPVTLITGDCFPSHWWCRQASDEHMNAKTVVCMLEPFLSCLQTVRITGTADV